MSFISWPLGISAGNIPFNSLFKYVNNIVSSSSANSTFINATKGATSASATFNVPTNNGFIINDIISAQYPSGNPTNQGSSYAARNVMNLQDNDFSFAALTNQGYNSLVSGLFNQFGLVSNIITAMLAYGNTDLLSASDTDLITQWPHNIYSNMLTINDAMTYSVRLLGTAADTLVNYANISEWRWIYPNRSRCRTATTLNITAMLAQTMNITNTIAYPVGLFRWDILRFDFFNPNILATSDERNTLLVSSTINGGDLLIDNAVFTLIYDNVAAPGCILLKLKIPINYDDGTGSINEAGQNTSRRVINPTYVVNSVEFPTVFRVGLEWIQNFIPAMAICNPVESPTIKVLLYGGNLITSLTEISNSYLGCKRLYMWRLVHDLIISRIINNGGVNIAIKNTEANGNITSNSVPGIFLCLLSGRTDYSILTSNSPFTPEPIWQNFWYPLSEFDNSNTTICCLTSVEIQAYLTPSLSDELIPANKYGEIRILVGDNNIPFQAVAFNQFSFSDPNFNTISANTCYSDTTNCWANYNPTPPPTTNPGTKVTVNNYWLYLFVIIVIICIFIFLMYYIFYYKNNRDPPKEKITHVPPPKN